MGDDNEFIKLPLEERCTHKLWKARLHGYTEAAKIFQEEEDEKAPVFNQFVGLVSKFVGDTNAAAQEKGLEAVLLFVQNAAVASKTVKDVMSVIVQKCIAAPKAKTKELAVQIALMYVEIEKQEQVVEELVKGLEHKNPKIVAGCCSALTLSLKEFGSKVVAIKPMLKMVGTLLEDRDKTVREETKAMVVEMFRWTKDSIKPQLSSLKPIQLTELETEFNKVRSEKPVPSRYLRSQQVQQARSAAEKDENGGAADDGGAENEAEVNVDPYDLMDPINVLSQIPGDFYEKIEAKKWQERKEAVESLEKILEYPKYEKGDYADLVRALMKIIAKDSNVIVVGISVKCMGRLAAGLKKGFQPYANTILPQLLEKFKEKKANVVTPLREAVDAIYPITTLEAIQEDVVASLENKNPAVKAETAAFLARCFTKATPTVLNKKLLKVLTLALLKTLNEPDPTVRDNSAEALGTAMKVVGERVISPFMPDLDKLKMDKIKEFCEKAVVVKVAAPPAPKSAPKAEKKEPSKPATAPSTASKGPATKKVLSAGAVKKTGAGAPKAKPVERERELSQEEVDEKAGELLDDEIVKGLVDSAWKVRLEAAESFVNKIKTVENQDGAAQVLVKILTRKPGFKDTNFQALKLKLEALKYVAENFTVTGTVVEIVLNDVVDKLGDAKCGSSAAEALTSLAEATELELVATQTLDYALSSQKNPKVQQESFNWVSDSIKEFGLVVQTKHLTDSIGKGLNATNAVVRTAAVNLCGTLYTYVGQQLIVLLDEKPSVMALVNAEIERRSGEKPPQPIRGARKNVAAANNNESGNSEDAAEQPEEKPLAETVSRTDISSRITDQLLSDLGNKDWKVRNEALLSLSNLINEAKSIKPNLGELPSVLVQRLNDSNGKLAVLALDICKAIALAIGPQCRTHAKVFFRGFLTALGDSKQWVRSAALACINTWGAEGGYKEFFEGEAIPDALKSGSPTLRTELWTWLADLLPTVKSVPTVKDEITLCVPHLYTSLEDRNADVRKSAQAAVLGVMMHVGYPNMVKQTEKLKPGSKAQVMAILDKTRPDLPMTAEPSAKPKGKKLEEAKKPDARGMTPKSKATAAVKPVARKKEEEVDTTPLLPVNNMKNQRLLDEQKLKTLRWNFTMPRSEFVDLLRELMTNAGFNKTLVANMFHSDFKYHLKAIESLSEDLGNVDALTSNLDLILKWMTLRFFDTNPSVLLKGLEYLQNVFSLLIDNDYTIYDAEANSFVPYLVLKIGDPKDAVRDRVRAILKQLSLMYASGKLFALIMDGLKSKNARQRTECLEELGNLIEEFGMTVCQPTPSAALKEISKQISDRDNSVRSAALNAIVKAWFIEGDKVYKLIGQISEKDLSLLEERVKRASKLPRPNVTSAARYEPKEKSPESKLNATLHHPRHQEQQQHRPPPEEEPEEAEPPPPPPSVQKSRPSDFGRNLFKEFDFDFPPIPKVELIEIDDSFLNSPVKIPERIAAKMSKNHAPPQPEQPKEDLLVAQVIREVGNTNINVAYQAAGKLRLVLESQERSVLVTYTDAIMDSLITQLKLVNSYSLAKYGLILPQTYRILFRIIDDIFGKKTSMGTTVKVHHLQGLLQELLLTLVEDKTAKFTEGGYNKWISVFVSRIIEDSDHTNVTCAVIKLLYDVVGNPPENPKVTDLTTKCLLKIIVLIKQGNPTWCEGLDLDDVLFECHLFFQAYPRHTWKDRPSIVPLKAIKTLLLALVGLKGKDIFSYLKRIENPCASELAIYLKHLLKTQPQVAKSTTTNNTRLSKAMSDHLSEIFMKIAYEETSKEGLLQFYEFKKQNPNLDFSSFLAPTSKYFQDYIENGLKNIEKERGPLKPSPRKPDNASASEPSISDHNSNAESQSVDPNLIDTGKNLAQHYLDKLRMIQARTGLHLTDLPDFEMNDSDGND